MRIELSIFQDFLAYVIVEHEQLARVLTRPKNLQRDTHVIEGACEYVENLVGILCVVICAILCTQHVACAGPSHT